MPKEMSYYRRYLQRLKEEWGTGFPVSDEVLDDLADAAEEKYENARRDGLTVEEKYENARRDGLTVDQAQELAMAVLVDGIGDEHT